MALRYGPFNGLENAWDAYDWARYFKRLFGNGVFPNPSTGLQVIAHENMQTKIKVGFGFIEGHYIENDSDYILTHDIADGVLKRIDRVVMRANFLINKAELLIKKGTPASTPVAPTLIRNTEYYELALSDVYIANGVTEITQANITDQRLNTELCGIVHGAVNQLDTTTLALQYQSAFAQMTAEQRQNFESWFAELQVMLDDNVAGNLQMQITQTNIKLAGEISVLAFGAKGNANYYNSITDRWYQDEAMTILANDDTQAFTNAINYAINNRYKLKIPPLQYLAASTILVRTKLVNISIYADKGARLVKNKGNYVILDLASSVTPFVGGYENRIRDIYLSNIDFLSPDSNGSAIKLRNFGRIYMDTIEAYRFNIAYDFGAGSEGYFHRVKWAGGNNGLVLNALDLDMQTIYFDECLFTDGVNGVTLTNAYDVHFNRTFIGNMSGYNLKMDGYSQALVMSQSHFEWGMSPTFILNSFIKVLFEKCEFAQTSVNQAIPIQVNNVTDGGKLTIKDCYHEQLSLIPLVKVMESSKLVDIDLIDNTPDIVNVGVHYEKSTNVMTQLLKISGHSINQFNQDFTKGFLGYVKGDATTPLYLDPTTKITGTNSVRFDAVGYWDFYNFSRYGVIAVEGDKITVDVISLGSLVVQGELKDMTTNVTTVVTLSDGGNLLSVENYPNGFTRRVITHTVPKNKQIANIRLNKTSNSGSTYLDYIDLKFDKNVGNIIAKGNAAPTEGTFVVGDNLELTPPIAGGWSNLKCVTAGTPGVWKGYGQIQA